MGFLDKLKNRFTGLKYATMLNGNMPIFSQFGEDIYASDIVQSIIDCIVSEISKTKPYHVLNNGFDRTPVNDSIQKMLNEPNELMTKSDFISKIIWNLFLNYNCLIYPVYEKVRNADGSYSKRYIAMYPLQPRQVDFLQDEDAKYFVRMKFKNGDEFTLPYDELIHIRLKYSFNEFLGGNAQGQPDNNALLKLLQMNDNMLEGVLNAMKTSYNINGIIKAGSFMDSEKVAKMVEEFNERLKNNESGLLGIDAKAEYIPIEKRIQAVDPDTLKFIDERILRIYGVSLAILSGDYTKEQYEAFYQKKLEPLIIAISEAFTKTLFSPREKALGHQIVFLPKELIFMNTSQVLEAIRLLGDAGDLYENEKRIALGFAPLKELEGVRKQSLNYIDVNIASDYQLNNSKKLGGTIDEQEQTTFTD